MRRLPRRTGASGGTGNWGMALGQVLQGVETGQHRAEGQGGQHRDSADHPQPGERV